jgi:hypothetical protein
MMLHRFLHIIFIFSFLPGVLFSQGIKTVSGESTIKVESTMSLLEAEDKAIELARIDALIKEFGQYVEQQNNMDLANGKVSFRSYGQTKVRGEWIRNIGEPEFKYFDKNVDDKIERWVSCTIKGEARKAMPKADLDVEVLTCPNKDCPGIKFKNEQLLYLYVKSPINGYLSVFIDDGTMVYRLLPYRNMSAQKSFPIKADKDYILFSKDVKEADLSPDELQLTTTRESETNTVYVVFSENDYTKPRLNDEQLDKDQFIIPKSLSRRYFENWLGENRAAFADFLDLKRTITIVSK